MALSDWLRELQLAVSLGPPSSSSGLKEVEFTSEPRWLTIPA